MNAEQARELLAQGKKDSTFEAPIPEDDSKAISEANDLVEMAETAWAQMVRGPEVEVLLKMAASYNGSQAPDPEEKSEPKPEVEPESKAEEKPKETPDESQGEGGDDLSKIEPWEGYDKEKVSDIIAGVNAAVREYDESNLTDLMGNVWAYEQAHKSRATILNHLEAVAQKLQSGQDLDPDPPDAGGDDDDAPQQDPSDSQPEEVKGEGEEQPGSGDDPEPGSDTPPEDPPEKAPEELKQEPKEEPKPKPRRQEKKQEDENLDDYQRLIQQVEEDLDRERVHKPKAPEEEIPDLPWDWTKMSNEQLQTFHGIYSAVAYYKGYQMSRDERIGLLCKAAADELHNALLVASEKVDENGKEKRVATLEAEIESDENVVLWRRRQRKHETFAASHRNERDSVGKLVDALSRHESMRHQEWERAGGKGGRK